MAFRARPSNRFEPLSSDSEFEDDPDEDPDYNVNQSSIVSLERRRIVSYLPTLVSRHLKRELLNIALNLLNLSIKLNLERGPHFLRIMNKKKPSDSEILAKDMSTKQVKLFMRRNILM